MRDDEITFQERGRPCPNGARNTALTKHPVSRRRFLSGAGAGVVAALVRARLPLAGVGMLLSMSGCLSEGQRKTLRSLFDAVVPGTWEGVVEDTLESGAPAPGADDARVMEWVESVMDKLPPPLNWLSSGMLRVWADDLALWSDVFHGWPFDGAPKFWQLPLGPSIWTQGRQYKIKLMQALFGTVVDLQYGAIVLLAKMAFYCDFHFEATAPGTRVGRAYIGFPLPPGTTPYTDFSYQQVLGTADSRMLTVGARAVLALP